MTNGLVVLAICTVVLLSTSTALAAGESPYAKTPTPREYGQYYPHRAMDLGKEGATVINCAVTANGLLTDCKVVVETPEGYGFGAAALRLSVLFRMKGGADGQRTDVSINFRLAAGPGPQEVVVTKKRELSWTRQPSSEDLDRVRPSTTVGPGSATLRCHVKSAVRLPPNERGTLYGCDAIKEEPANAGFAKAAQSLVPMFQFEGSSLPPMKADATIDIDLSWAPMTGG